MQIVIDASALLAVVLGEPERASLIAATTGSSLLTPESTPWEFGNALIAGLRRRRLRADTVQQAWRAFEAIRLRTVGVNVPGALRLAGEHGLYAYDAYVLQAALDRRTPLLTLDKKQRQVFVEAGGVLLEAAGR